MLRRLGVRRKILATLAVPVLVLLLGATFLSLDALDRSRVSGLQRDFSLATRAQDATVEALQKERELSIRVVHGDEDLSAELASARARTDTTIAGLNQAFKDVDPENVEPAVVASIQDAGRIRSTENMSALRGIVDRDNPDLEGSIQTGFNDVINGQLNVATSLAAYADDRNLARYVDNYAQASIALDQVRLEAVVGELLIQDHLVSAHSQTQLRSAAVLFAEGDSITRRTKDAISRLGLVEYPTVTARYTSVRESILVSNPRESNLEARLAWAEMVGVEAAELAETRDTVREATITEASRIDSAVTRQTILTILAAVAAVVLSIAVALLIARQITEPLKRLTEAAKKVRADLPALVEQVAVPGQGPEMAFESIAVETDDEIGELANAFNEVNTTTLEVARQQALLRGSIAEMFINVARRDQVLLNRQLSFLDDLERAEEDPTTLANLFRLDHLATRMRRNAESLLVLAGIESGRRVRQPMPLSDVVRTAASEIDQYDRIDLEITTDPLMLGHNALAAAHMLAELLENATVFSEPGTPVTVQTAEDARWVTITVIDEGLGMSEDELEEANEKAATYAAGEIVGASRLGLYVVGRLAYKLGASVRLAKVQDGAGTLARVMLPRALFAEAAPLEAPTDPLAPETRAATAAWVVPEIEAAETPLPSRLSEPEPPVGVPVDLDALTNGATGTGMPRRRTRAADPAAQAPSAALSQLDERDIVLPPLQAAELPQEFAANAEEWRPIASPTMGPVGLPSREPRTEVAPVAEVPAPAGDTPAPQRAGMFSNFRARKEFEMLEEARRAKAAGAAVPVDAPVADEGVAQDADREGPAITLAASRVAGWVGTEQQGEPLARRRAPEAAPDAADEQAPAEHIAPAEDPASDEMVIPDLVPDEDEVDLTEPVWSPVMEAATEAPLVAPEAPVDDVDAPFVPQFQLGAPLSAAPVPEGQHGGAAESVELDRTDEAVPAGSHDPFGLAAMADQSEAWSPEFAAGGLQNLGDAAWESQVVADEQRPSGAHVGSVASAEEIEDSALTTRRARRARHADADVSGFTAPSVPTPSGVGFDFLPQAEDGSVIQPSGYSAPSAASGYSAPTAYSAHDAVSYPPPPAVEAAADVIHVAEVEPDAESAPVLGYEGTQAEQAYGASTPAPSAPSAEPAWSYPPAAAAPVEQAPDAPVQPAPWDVPAAVVSPLPATLSFDEAISSRSERHDRKPKRGLFKRKPKTSAQEPQAPAPTAPSAPSGLASSAVFEPLLQAAPAPAESAGELWSAPGAGSSGAPYQPSPAQAYAPPSFAPPASAPSQPSAPSAFEPEQPAAYQPAAAYEPLAPRPAIDAADDFGGEGFSYNPSGWAPPAEPAPMAMRSASSPAAEPAPVAAAAPAAGASWATGRSIDAELSARLALQAGIQEQALAELSQLSSYRPNQQVADTTSALTKRVRSEVPSTTVEDDVSKKISRDAAELRTRLSAFMSATSRARDGSPTGSDAGDGTAFTPDPAPQSR